MRVSKYIKKWFPLFAAPTFLAFVLAFVIPFGMGMYLSFTTFVTIDNAQWVGFDNYVKIFTNDSGFLAALWFTLRFTVVSVITVNVFAYGLALLLTRALKGTNIFRAVFFLPNLIGGIVLGWVWKLLINGILGQLFSQDITYSSSYLFWGLVIVVNWQMIGYMMIIYIAAIQNIPGEVDEAAGIDGARFFSKLIHVTIPMTASAVTICMFLTLANCLKLFDQNLALGGGARDSTEGLALHIFNVFYGSGSMASGQGLGQAKAVIFFVFVSTIAFLQLRLTRGKETDG
jgi:raffinose/stachyose/melibiose transport system permease protein